MRLVGSESCVVAANSEDVEALVHTIAGAAKVLVKSVLAIDKRKSFMVVACKAFRDS